LGDAHKKETGKINKSSLRPKKSGKGKSKNPKRRKKKTEGSAMLGMATTSKETGKPTMSSASQLRTSAVTILQKHDCKEDKGAKVTKLKEG